ncbi:hypothetical protein HELRODRAFT_180388 [Helobdella robusta]|uniref:Uncharacterized protein n=1 Tax=Helobdella robusta TaxID=6412 RepID=T1FFV4_HELRO|nr:hypothetical protein HELRODRAFT_180388 [Helobdella robusta]ESN93973.1 hypothetical protein HELRODRAFT_180388 [Helobdella robusta]
MSSLGMRRKSLEAGHKGCHASKGGRGSNICDTGEGGDITTSCYEYRSRNFRIWFRCFHTNNSHVAINFKKVAKEILTPIEFQSEACQYWLNVSTCIEMHNGFCYDKYNLYLALLETILILCSETPDGLAAAYKVLILSDEKQFEMDSMVERCMLEDGFMIDDFERCLGSGQCSENFMKTSYLCMASSFAVETPDPRLKTILMEYATIFFNKLGFNFELGTSKF